MKYDCAIIGGGIVGLSLAYQLSAHRLRVIVADATRSSHQASWAAAGILPPADLKAAPDPYETLRAFSRQTLETWCRSLRTQTGIDPEFRSCGAVHLARTPGETAALVAYVDQCRDEGIRAERIAVEQLGDHEPALAHLANSTTVLAAYHLPDEAQVRPPRLLKALRAACELQSVDFVQAELQSWKSTSKNLVCAQTNVGTIEARKYCITAGAWSQPLARALEMPVEVQPWRGQMLLLSCPRPPIAKVIYEGPNYIVPRQDGQVLIGSTMEEVGFNSHTTNVAKVFLRNLGETLVPALREAHEIAFWAGIRPGTADGLPYLGRSAVARNVFIATGHFRSGIALAAGTAVVMSELITDQPVSVNIQAFRPDR